MTRSRRTRYSVKHLLSILGRAIEIDGSWRLADEQDIRRIARDVGINEEAVSEALQEHRARAPRFPTGLLSLMLAGGAVGALGPLLRDSVGPVESLFGILAMQIIAVLVAAHASGKLKHVRFQLSNAALWCGWVFSRGLVDSPRWVMLDVGLEFGAMTAVAGGVVIVLRDVFGEPTEVAKARLVEG